MTPSYVIDTNVFISFQNYYEKTFPTLWDNLSGMADGGVISSVAEVKRELRLKWTRGELKEWVAWIKARDIFPELTESEQQKVNEVMATYPSAVVDKQLNRDTWADPQIIAKGIALGATVVSMETRAANAPAPPFTKIPDICDHFGARRITPREFMLEQNWRF